MAGNINNSLKAHRLILIFILLSLSGLTFLSCSRSYNPDIDRGSDYLYRVGYPEMQIAAIGLFDANSVPGINVTADIEYSSLIYKDFNDTLQAKINLEIQIIPKDKDSTATSIDKSYSFSIKKKSGDKAAGFNDFTFEKRFPVKPGNYDIYVSLTDLTSGKTTVRKTHAELPNPDSGNVNLTNVLLLGRDIDNPAKRGYLPLTTYDVPGKIDTLKFEFQVNKPNNDKQLVINMRLIRFKSDTLPAREMYAPNPSPSNIQYRGIDYDEKTVVETQKRVLQSESGNILIQYQTHRPMRGNYRFEVTLSGDNITKDADFKARDFGVKSEDYPYVRTPRELAAPLYYLMSRKNYKKMMAIQNPDSLKGAIDKFWLGHIQNVQKAKGTLQLYYQRVEQANKQFSNYKEGWKTDLGMMYILFGPPYYVDNSLDVMQWTYGYDRSDPNRNFVFIRTKLKTEYYPFYNYILQRRSFYFNLNYQRTQDWLTGYVLDHDLF